MSDAPHSKAHLEILRLEEEIATSEARGYDDGYKAGLAAGSSVAEEVTRDCEACGAARAVEQCRRLTIDYAVALEASGQHYATIPVRELLRRIEIASIAPPGSTAGELLAKYRPAPPSVVSALRATVEAFPDETNGGEE